MSALQTLDDRSVRPRQLGAWYVAEYLVRSMRAYGITILVGGLGQPLIFLLAIGVGLGVVIDRPVAEGTDGPVPYLWFVAPALMVSAVVGTAVDEFTYNVMSGFKWRRVFWAVNATPVTPGQIADGMILAVTGRMIVTAVGYGLLMWLFGATGSGLSVVAISVVAALGGLAFGLPLMAYSARQRDDKGQFAMVQRFIFTPLFLFSGTFFPLEAVPEALRWVGWVSPLWHASEVGRVLSYGQAGSWPVWAHLLALVVPALVGWWLARRAFQERLR